MPYRKQEERSREIATERIVILFKNAALMFAKQPELSNRYVELARKIAMKCKVRLPSSLRRQFCRHCNHYLVPGSNCRIRTRQGKIITYCLDCKHYSRHPFKA